MITEDDQEWTVEGFIAECDRIGENPPAAPAGFELVECSAEPRHWPTYVAQVDGMYPAPCHMCITENLSRDLNQMRCEKEHRRWKSWRIWDRITSRLYVLGIIAGSATWFGRCEFCGIGRQHMAPRWRGKRPYILGLQREQWACLRRGHRRSETSYGVCSICLPCPSCGSTDPDHSGDCGVRA